MNSRQPNSNHCFVCGLHNPFGLHLTFTNTAEGEVSADLNLGENFQGYPGVIHGGIIAAMLDEACGRAFMTGEEPRFMFTARLETQYRKNVPVGEPLRLVGQAGPARGRTAKATATITSQAGEVLAEASALLVDLPADWIENADLSDLGWRVYSDEELEQLSQASA